MHAWSDFSDAYNIFFSKQAYALKLLESAITNLGYTVEANDTFEILRNRMQILEFACKLGHEGCIEHVVKLYRGLRENGTEWVTPIYNMTILARFSSR